MNLFLVLATFLTGALLLSSCGESTQPPAQQQDSVLSISVVDGSGQPLSNASVGLLFSFVPTTDTLPQHPSLALLPNPVIASSSVAFPVPAASNIKLLLLRYRTRDTVTTVLNAALQAGEHTISMSTSALPNQGYIYTLQTPSGISERMLVVMNPDTAEFVPLMTTDNAGHFSIDPRSLPVGERFERTFETGQWGGNVVVSNNVGIIIRRSGGGSVVRWISVDKAHGIDTTFTFQ